MDETLWTLVYRTVSASGSIEKSVFVLLVLFSLASWCIIFMKLYDVHIVRRNNARFLELFDMAPSFGAALSKCDPGGPCPLYAVFSAGVDALGEGGASGGGPQTPTGGEQPQSAPAARPTDPRSISLSGIRAPMQLALLAMQAAARRELQRLQRGNGFLATIGSTSPFIGLFGTVWGIMSTFRELGNAKSASLAVVAPGISSALIATAAGLAVAIPAVMAYNYFLGRIDNIQDESDAFIERIHVWVDAAGFGGK